MSSGKKEKRTRGNKKLKKMNKEYSGWLEIKKIGQVANNLYSRFIGCDLIA